MNTRRDFLKTIAGGIVVPTLAACRRGAVVGGGGATSGWDAVPGILARIKPPMFPDRAFDVTRYGAVGDGATDCTAAFRAAIDACTKAGGGRVTRAPTGERRPGESLAECAGRECQAAGAGLSSARRAASARSRAWQPG